MSYESARDLVIESAYGKRIDDLIGGYRKNADLIVMLPGGMGSQLDRSTEKYQEDNPSIPQIYNPIWIDSGIIFSKDARHLEITGQGRDAGDHIVIPDGPLRFLVDPYDATKKYFADNKYNYIVFGFDWRRSLEENADYLRFFLKRLRAKLRDAKGVDPAGRIFLVCHSQGGLVAKVFLHRHAQTAAMVKSIITVGTPFYGTASHMQRYYQGVALLNILYGTTTVAKIVGTLPGPYVLMYLDKKTFDRDGAKIGLASYPVIDDHTRQPADPYDQDNFERYPTWMKRRFLDAARDSRRSLTRPLSPTFSQRMFHIRATRNPTEDKLKWLKVDGRTYDPVRNGQPVYADPQQSKGEGDGTVPVWSARLADTANARIYDLRDAKEHQDLMEHEETLRAVCNIIDKGVVPKKPAKTLQRYGGNLAVASENAVMSFVGDVAAKKIVGDDDPALDEKLWRGIMRRGQLC